MLLLRRGASRGWACVCRPEWRICSVGFVSENLFDSCLRARCFWRFWRFRQLWECRLCFCLGFVFFVLTGGRFTSTKLGSYPNYMAEKNIFYHVLVHACRRYTHAHRETEAGGKQIAVVSFTPLALSLQVTSTPSNAKFHPTSNIHTQYSPLNPQMIYPLPLHPLLPLHLPLPYLATLPLARYFARIRSRVRGPRAASCGVRYA